MEDNSFDPRTSSPASIDAPEADDALFNTLPQRDAFALTTRIALRLWLASALVLALAAGSAWTMRRPADATTSRLAADFATSPAAGREHAPAP